ncbi:hypothetical protein JKP88DRAFT_249684 [Tribonema minus]|uniref:Uncharacterized protein n=1 Tax=Tribonema minus TaxID=303371 RepID=A0A835YKG7_9STRA|nr:hypothetical protein JKP88DRAFT_249684 [Tribonema minus]
MKLLVLGLPFSRHGARTTTVIDSSSPPNAVAVMRARAQRRDEDLPAFEGTSVSTDPRTASCSPSSSSHSTTWLSGDGSASVPHDSAGTGNGHATVLNGGDVIAEQCSASCTNICEAVISSGGNTSVPRNLEGSNVDLAPAPSGDSGAGMVTQTCIGCDGVGDGITRVSISMASAVDITTSEADSSRSDEDSPAVL